LARLRVFGVLDGGCTPSLVYSGTIDRLATMIHERYREQQQRAGTRRADHPTLAPWDTLDEWYKESNRAQAVHMHDQLRAHGYELVPLEGAGRDGPTIRLPSQEIEELAEAEHVRWMEERQHRGWQYGHDYDDVAKTHPSLVKWVQLPPEEQEKDRDMVREAPDRLSRVGLKLRPPGWRLPGS
jgi:hypothetical protein